MNIGKIYNVNHSRKGDFEVILEGEDETWAWGIIVDGHTKALCPHNVAGTGERITVRKSLCTMTEVDNGTSE